MVDTLSWGVFWKTKNHPDSWRPCSQWVATLDEALQIYNAHRECPICNAIRVIKRRESHELIMQDWCAHE